MNTPPRITNGPDPLALLLGTRLALARKHKQLSVLAAASLTRMASARVVAWESGKAMPRLEQIYELSCLYEVSIDWVLGRVEERTSRAQGGQPSVRRKSIATARMPVKHASRRPSISPHDRHRIEARTRAHSV